MRPQWVLWLAFASTVSVTAACDCCVKNATSSECQGDSKLLPRPDCDCCLVCGVSAGEACDDKARPCNPTLRCSADGVCTDASCRSDGDCEESLFCLGGVCSDPCSVLDHCRDLLKGGACQVRSHRPVCTCPAGSTLDSVNKRCVKGGCKLDDNTTVDVGAKIAREDCQKSCVCEASGRLTCTPASCPPGLYRRGSFSEDDSCVELRSSVDTTGCCVNVVCTDTIKAASQALQVADTSNTADTQQPTILARTTSAPATSATTPKRPWLDMLPLSITHNSTRLQLPSTGGILYYNADGRARVDVELPSDVTETTVTSLVPGTGYLFIWQAPDGEKRSLRVDTRAGCVTDASSHAIGETYHMGCQSTCVCGGPNQPSCRPRCSFTRGTVTDKSCSERPDFDDPECCVQLVCAVTSSGGQIVPDAPVQTSTTPEPTTTVTTREPASATTTTTTTKTTTTAATTTTTTASSATTSEAATTTPSTTPAVTTNLTTTVPDASTTPEPVTQITETTTVPTATPSPPTTTSSALIDEKPSSPLSAAAALPLLDADSQPQPTLIATSRSHDSVTLVWDDFKPAEYTRGYLAQWRRAGDEQWRTHQVAPILTQSVPQVTIDGLMPSTTYEARVTLHDAGGTPGDTTEMIRLTTAVGCNDGNMTFGVGETLNHGCDESCICEAGGEAKCQERCQLPFYRAGHFQQMPLCKETPHDECCVVAVCDAPMEDEEAGQGAEGMDPCEFVHCGANARCEMQKPLVSGQEPGAMDAVCVCLEGYIKDDIGDCIPAVASSSSPTESNTSVCRYEDKTYESGQEFFKGCQEKCICKDQGQASCMPRCKVDQKTMLDLPSNCRRIPEPEPNHQCCMMLECNSGADSAGPVLDPEFAGCIYGEQKYQPDEVFYQGCKSRCTCNGFGDVSCQPRCPLQQPADDPSCSVQPDPADPCCNISVCTPSLSKPTDDNTTDTGAGPSRSGTGRSHSGAYTIKIVDLTQVDSSATQLEVDVPPAVAEGFPTKDKGNDLRVEWKEAAGDEFWMGATVPHDSILIKNGRLVALVRGLAAPDTKVVRVTYGGQTSAEVRGSALVQVAPPALKESEAAGGTVNASGSCTFNNMTHNVGDEFHDGCRQFCICTDSGVNCASIECPHHFGPQQLNPDCLRWSDPGDFEPSPPNCCPDVKCEDDGSCVFEGETYRNFQTIPEKITGCEESCVCEFGNVTCRSACPPVPATPPRDLPCEITQVTLGPLPNGCCKVWQCVPGSASVTTHPPVPSNVHNNELAIGNDINSLKVRDVTSESVKVLFSIPPALVGLPGRTEVLFTDNPGLSADEDQLWDVQVFRTTSGLLDTMKVSWELQDLLPDTAYRLQVRAVFDATSTILRSNVVGFKTHQQQKPTLPPKVPLDAELQASDVNTTSALIQWRRLTEQELQYIDGIQLRYRDVDVDAQVWTMTPFIHRELNTYQLTELKPDTNYQVDIVLMPFQDKHTEMVSTKPLRITTLPVFDRYAFNVSLSKVTPTSTSVRVAWTGVPQPQYQYVNVYRLVYIDEKEREERHSFKLAKTADDADITIKGLKPSSKYQVWLEAYLKNGKKKVSEVQEFDTKPGPIGKAEEIRGLELEPSEASSKPPPNNYYSGMVAAAIIATMAIVLCLFLAFLLVKKASQAAVQPTPPSRKNGPSYENPAFKTSEPVEEPTSQDNDSV